MTSPDFTGFQTAQETLRGKFGRSVRFHLAPNLQYPPGTPLTISGRPLDPTVEAIGSAGSGDMTASANISRGGQGPDDDSSREAPGYLGERTVMLIMSVEEFAPVASAEAFTVDGVKYRLTQVDEDFFGPVERRLVYGEQE